jgi:hypothetical protein
MLRRQAVEQIRRWAEDAEGGNYHAFAECLYVLSEAVKERYGPEVLTVIKSLDEFPARKNLLEMVIEDE